MTIQSMRLKLKRTNQLNLRISSRIPNRLDGSGGISVVKTNGVYTISPENGVLGDVTGPGPMASVAGQLAAFTDGNNIEGSGATKDDLLSVAGLSHTGVGFPSKASTGPDVWNARTITGTANEITVTNGSGSAGNPTLSLPASMTFTGKTVTGGTYASPSLTTPSLGVATATTVNKVTFTPPATGATLTIPDGVTLTGPAASGTAMTLGNAETVTGAKTFADTKLLLAGSSSGSTILKASAAASGSITLPAATDTLVGKATTDTLTNKTLTSPVINTPSGIVKGDVGLGNVDNTSDATKNSASATLTNKTIDTAGPNTIRIAGTSLTAVTGTGSVVLAASPTLTGTPAAPTAAVDTNTTQLATTAMVIGQAASATPLGSLPTAAVGTSTRFARADHVHPGRETLTANRTYYIRSDGSDSNTGLVNSSGGAFLTIQKAVYVTSALDIATFNVTIQVVDGTYTGAVVASNPWLGSGTVTIQGNSSTPANVLINITSSNAITAQNNCAILVKDMKIQTTGAYCLIAAYGGILKYSNIIFGSASNAHTRAEMTGIIEAVGNYTISGGATGHYSTGTAGQNRALSITVTLTGTPAFSSAFASAAGSGCNVFVQSVTFFGSATGVRYSATANGVVNSVGRGASFFPGNSAGTTATGGQYL